jgi:holo-[acyl-carrier protein] synthase
VILRTGVDLVEIQRFQNIDQGILGRFLQRVFTPEELEQTGRSLVSLAGRFAAKEAVVKALGTGIGDVHWHDVEILTDGEGAPYLKLTGEAQKKGEALHLLTWSLSISHTHSHAISMAVAMGEEETRYEAAGSQ